jgi:hypothetical protein
MTYNICEISKKNSIYIYWIVAKSHTHAYIQTSLVAWWSNLLTTNHKVPGSIPGSAMGIFPLQGKFSIATMVWVACRI